MGNEMQMYYSKEVCAHNLVRMLTNRGCMG